MHFITNGYKHFSKTNSTAPRQRVPLNIINNIICKYLVMILLRLQIMTVLSHPDEDNPMSSEETSHSPLPKISRALDLGLQKVRK